jgi:hypothetical protein
MAAGVATPSLFCKYLNLNNLQMGFFVSIHSKEVKHPVFLMVRPKRLLSYTNW